MSSSLPIISLSSVSFKFASLKVIEDISFDINKGRVMAILGENGAGKTTLMSILAGQLQPDKGQIFSYGKQVKFSSPEKAIKAGVGMVYQDFKLIETMTVAENILLAGSSSFFLSKKKVVNQIDALLKEFGMSIDLDNKVANLSMGEKQQVEVLKLLFQKSEVLIFDESTTLLTPQETADLFVVIRKLQEQGKSVIFISHKLKEVIEIADDILVLNKGELVKKIEKTDTTTINDLILLLDGDVDYHKIDKTEITPKQVILKVNSVDCGGEGGASFELRKGEILSLVGVAGNGQKKLVEAICGVDKKTMNDVHILGMDKATFFSSSSWDQSLSYIPEDRFGIATDRNLDLVDNFLLTTQQGFTRGPWLDKEKAREKAMKLIRDFNIQATDTEVLAGELSGGNVQKMILARAFYSRPRLMVIEHPTQGLDLESTKDIWNLLIKAREQAGILIITANIPEALTLSDRIGVMYNGEIVDLFSSDDVGKTSKIQQIMSGVSQDSIH